MIAYLHAEELLELRPFGHTAGVSIVKETQRLEGHGTNATSVLQSVVHDAYTSLVEDDEWWFDNVVYNLPKLCFTLVSIAILVFLAKRVISICVNHASPSVYKSELEMRMDIEEETVKLREELECVKRERDDIERRFKEFGRPLDRRPSETNLASGRRWKSTGRRVQRRPSETRSEILYEGTSRKDTLDDSSGDTKLNVNWEMRSRALSKKLKESESRISALSKQMEASKIDKENLELVQKEKSLMSRRLDIMTRDKGELMKKLVNIQRELKETKARLQEKHQEASLYERQIELAQRNTRNAVREKRNVQKQAEAYLQNFSVLQGKLQDISAEKERWERKVKQLERDRRKEKEKVVTGPRTSSNKENCELPCMEGFGDRSWGIPLNQARIIEEEILTPSEVSIVNKLCSEPENVESSTSVVEECDNTRRGSEIPNSRFDSPNASSFRNESDMESRQTSKNYETTKRTQSIRIKPGDIKRVQRTLEKLERNVQLHIEKRQSLELKNSAASLGTMSSDTTSASDESAPKVVITEESIETDTAKELYHGQVEANPGQSHGGVASRPCHTMPDVHAQETVQSADANDAEQETQHAQGDEPAVAVAESSSSSSDSVVDDDLPKSWPVCKATSGSNVCCCSVCSLECEPCDDPLCLSCTTSHSSTPQRASDTNEHLRSLFCGPKSRAQLPKSNDGVAPTDGSLEYWSTTNMIKHKPPVWRPGSGAQNQDEMRGDEGSSCTSMSDCSSCLQQMVSQESLDTEQAFYHVMQDCSRSSSDHNFISSSPLFQRFIRGFDSAEGVLDDDRVQQADIREMRGDSSRT